MPKHDGNPFKVEAEDRAASPEQQPELPNIDWDDMEDSFGSAADTLTHDADFMDEIPDLELPTPEERRASARRAAREAMPRRESILQPLLNVEAKMKRWMLSHKRLVVALGALELGAMYMGQKNLPDGSGPLEIGRQAATNIVNEENARGAVRELIRVERSMERLKKTVTDLIEEEKDHVDQEDYEESHPEEERVSKAPSP